MCISRGVNAGNYGARHLRTRTSTGTGSARRRLPGPGLGVLRRHGGRRELRGRVPKIRVDRGTELDTGPGPGGGLGGGVLGRLGVVLARLGVVLAPSYKARRDAARVSADGCWGDGALTCAGLGAERPSFLKS